MNPERMTEEMLRLGKILVTQLFVLFKTSLNYVEGHGAVDSPVANVIKVVREIQRRNEEASLRIRGGYLYLGDQRLKPDSGSFHAFGFVMDEMTARGIGSICFNPSASTDELRRFVYALQEGGVQAGAEGYPELLERLEQRAISGIELETLPPEDATAQADRNGIPDDRLRNDRLKARLLYQQSLEVVDQVLKCAAAGKPLWLRKSKRVIQQMIDLLARDESSLIALVTLPRQERSPQSHASNVCILSLALGRRLGMAKFAQCELGLAALFHDIGKAGEPEPPEAAELSAQERLALEAHPVIGVRKVMQLKGLDSLSSRIITGVFEHHLLADFSGYPRLHYQRLSLCGRVISIADGFDALISSPVAGGRGPYPPAKALGFLLARAGKGYDQALMKLFISVIGLHPIGSLLQLDSRELAVVVGNHTRPDRYDRPRVKIISDPRGLEVDGAELDLALPASSRTITGILDPRVYQLDVVRYFR